MKTYDPAKFDIVFAGRHLNKGVAEGTFLTIKRTTPGFSSKAGVDGEVTRTRSHDKRATATLTVMQTSEVNEILSGIYAGDLAAVVGLGVAAFFVQDRSGTTVMEASKAYIADDPEFKLDATASERAWTFELSDVTMFHGSNAED